MRIYSEYMKPVCFNDLILHGAQRHAPKASGLIEYAEVQHGRDTIRVYKAIKDGKPCGFRAYHPKRRAIRARNWEDMAAGISQVYAS